LPFKSTDEKTVLLASNGCTQLDYILSANLAAFVMQKVDEDASWYDKPVQQQRADVYALAADKQAKIQSGLVPIMPEGI